MTKEDAQAEKAADYSATLDFVYSAKVNIDCLMGDVFSLILFVGKLMKQQGNVKCVMKAIKLFPKDVCKVAHKIVKFLQMDYALYALIDST